MPSLTDLPTPPESQRKRKPALPLTVPTDNSDEFIDIYELLECAGDVPQNRPSRTVPETRQNAEAVFFGREYDPSSQHIISQGPKKRVHFQDESSIGNPPPELKATQLSPHSSDSNLKREESGEMTLGRCSANKRQDLQAIGTPISESADATYHRQHGLPVTGQALRNIQTTYAERKRRNDELFKLALSERWHKDRRQDIKASRDIISERLRAIKTMIHMWEEHESLLTERGKLVDEVASLYARNLDIGKGEAELDSLDEQIELHGEEFLHAISAAGFAEFCLPAGKAALAVDDAASSKSVSTQDECQTGDSKGAETSSSCWQSSFVNAKAVLQQRPNGDGKCK